jgi:phosphatidylserine/phosphatidylglycerophosphate/cardiolipin synthase-like enzyme
MLKEIKEAIKPAVIAILSILMLASVAIATDVNINSPASIYFSPNGGCTTAIVGQIKKAQTEILVQAYSFSSKPIADALVSVATRTVNPVKVSVILDSATNLNITYSMKDTVAKAGIEVYMDANHSIAHNKIMIIDNMYVITGSFNYSSAAEYSNAENVFIMKSTQAAAVYKKNWLFHKLEPHTSKYLVSVPTTT